MVNLIWADRKSPILSSSNLACLAHIPSINLTSGCAHNCIYCYARGYSVFPGENKVVIFKNILDKLKSEFLHKRNKPQAVYFSPSSDIFQPIPDVLELSHAVLELLLSMDIGIAFVTKGRIPDKTLGLLLNHANKVRAQIGLITHDDNIRKIFEPNTASVVTRLLQMAQMVAGGISVEARIIPIIPGITDTLHSIDHLYSAISMAGVKHAAISTLFLRPAIIASLRTRISDQDVFNNLLSVYKNSSRMAVKSRTSSVVALSSVKREEIYERFRQRAKNNAIDLSICGCMNPDIGGTCNITGRWPKYNSQQGWFDQED
jgi:DNA repair photolyase